MLSTNIDITLEASLSEFIEHKHDDFVLFLFMGNCVLIGKSFEEKKAIIDQFSASCAIHLCKKTKGNFKDSIAMMIKDGLNSQLDVSFDQILKDFIQTNVTSNLASLTNYLLIIFDLVNALERNNYQLNHTIINQWQHFELRPTETSTKSKSITNEQIIKHVNTRSIHVSDKKYKAITKKPIWNDLLRWAEQSDGEVANTVAKTESRAKSKIGNFVILHGLGGLACIMLTMYLMHTYDPFKVQTMNDKANESESDKTDKINIKDVIPLIVFAAIVGGIIGTKSGTLIIKKTEKDAVNQSIDTYKGKNASYNNSLSAAFDKFFNLELTEYYSPDDQNQKSSSQKEEVIDSEKKTQYTIKLTKQSESEQLLPQFETDQQHSASIASRRKNKIKSVRRFSHREIVTSDELKATASVFIDHYESTTTHLIREMTRGKIVTTLVLEKEVAGSIPDKKARKIFKNNFKTGELGKKIKRLGKEQYEVRSGYNERIFGLLTTVLEREGERKYNQRNSMDTKEVIEFNKFANGLH